MGERTERRVERNRKDERGCVVSIFVIRFGSLCI